MKVKLTSDWLDYGIVHKCGSVVDVSDRDGLLLVSAGHIQMHPDTPAKTNSEMYGLGCVPTPFSAEMSRTFTEIAVDIAQSEPKNEGTQKA
jgi:hypothetical protein